MSFLSSYPLGPLSEAVQFINGDRSANYPKGDDYVATGIPFISASDLGDGQINYASARQISENAYQRLRSGKIQSDDVLFCLRGSIGKIAYIKVHQAGAIASSLVIIRATERIDPRYLFFGLSSQAGQQAAAGLNNGAAQPNLSVSELQKIEMPLPAMRIQRRIAGILSAYDDLIENSQRRIKILEEMARRLYREWFVHFRFPGHETCRFVDSPLGEVPEGWEVKRLADIAVVNRSTINTRKPPDRLRYIDIASVSPGQIDSVTDYLFSKAPGRARRVVSHGDVLWSCVRPNRRSHALVLSPEPNTIASTGFAVLSATAVPFTFLYQALTTDEFVAYLANNATGAAYPAVTAPIFEAANLLCPQAGLLQHFGELTVPIAEEVHVMQQQIRNLRRTRDLLLPRLLSGQINVEALPEPVVAEP
jgi:type I restriction enzyme, S subunit